MLGARLGASFRELERRVEDEDVRLRKRRLERIRVAAADHAAGVVGIEVGQSDRGDLVRSAARRSEKISQLGRTCRDVLERVVEHTETAVDEKRHVVTAAEQDVTRKPRAVRLARMRQHPTQRRVEGVALEESDPPACDRERRRRFRRRHASNR